MHILRIKRRKTTSKIGRLSDIEMVTNANRHVTRRETQRSTVNLSSIRCIATIASYVGTVGLRNICIRRRNVCLVTTRGENCLIRNEG